MNPRQAALESIAKGKHGRTGSKGTLHKLLQAKIHHKKRPDIKPRTQPEIDTPEKFERWEKDQARMKLAVRGEL